MSTPLIIYFRLLNKRSVYELLNIHTFKAGLWCLLFCFCLATSIGVYAQAPAKQWDKTFGGSTDEVLTTQIKTADGGYLLGGGSLSEISGEKSATSRGGEDYWIVKLDKEGTKQWDKTFGGSGNDRLNAILPTSDGGYLLGGSSASDVNGDRTAPSKGKSDFWIVKIDANGNKQWDRAYGGDDNEKLTTMVTTTDGGYILGGSSSSGISGDKSEPNSWPDSSTDDFWLIKISGSWVRQWDKSYGSVQDGIPTYDVITSIFKTTDGNYLIGGTSQQFKNDVVVIKINEAGTTLSQQLYSGEERYDQVSAITLSSDGGYVVGGSEENFLGDHFFRYFIIKVDARGNRQWKKRFGGPDYYYGVGNYNGSYLTTMLETSDKGYLIAGFSDNPNVGDKTEQSRGGYDYWLVKVDKEGNKQWDKTFGGNAEDRPVSLLENSDKSYLIAGNTSSANNGDKSQPSRGGTDYWIVKTTAELVPQTCSATGSILQELWLNVPGSSLSTIPLNTVPTASYPLTSFETPVNKGDNYAERIRGYLCVPQSGSYTFYIAGDDNCALYLSTDDDPAKKTKIASVPSYTLPRQWNKYAAQQSAAISLQAGKKYYIEALHKEGAAGDHLAVAWQAAATEPITIIPGSYLSPYLPQGEGTISREYWANVAGDLVTDIPLNTPATFTDKLPGFETAPNSANNYAQRIRGYLHPQLSGSYRFYLTGDNQCELFLSSDDDPAKKVKIASVPFYTWFKQWNKYSSQQSALIYLVAGRKYYIEALHKEGAGGDHLAVGWQTPGTTSVSVIAGTYLSPFLASPTSSIARMAAAESLEKQVKLYPNPFEDKLTVGSSQQGKCYISLTDNLGRVVYQTTAQAETELNLAHLKAGVYVVKVSVEDGITQIFKVVKK